MFELKARIVWRLAKGPSPCTKAKLGEILINDIHFFDCVAFFLRGPTVIGEKLFGKNVRV